MEDIINSIKASLYDRASSPLLGTFIISWIIWNYELLLIIMSNMPAPEKISYIQNDIYLNWWCQILQVAVLPILSSVIFIYIYPIPAKVVYRHSKNQQKILKKIKIGIDDETPISEDDFKFIKKKLSTIESAHYNEISAKDAEIESLRTKNESLKQKLDQTNEGSKATKKPPNKKPTEKEDIKNPAITYIKIGDEIFILGEDYLKSNPAELNIIKPNIKLNLNDSLKVSFKSEKSLKEKQEYQVFDGYSVKNTKKEELEITKKEFEEKYFTVAITEPNPRIEGKRMVVSNKVQFVY